MPGHGVVSTTTAPVKYEYNKAALEDAETTVPSHGSYTPSSSLKDEDEGTPTIDCVTDTSECDSAPRRDDVAFVALTSATLSSRVGRETVCERVKERVRSWVKQQQDTFGSNGVASASGQQDTFGPDVAVDAFGLPVKLVLGLQHYPPWIQESAICHLQQNFAPRSGDVIVVSHFPLRGLRRMIVSLVEGKEDLWSGDIYEKPWFLENAASLSGPSEYLDHVAGWQGRRCFKSVALPETLPCRYPFEATGGVEPKVCVFVADPRYALTLWFEMINDILQSHGQTTPSMSHFLDAVVTKKALLFGDYFAHGLAWAREAAAKPGSVRLFVAERFASCDPKEVQVAVAEFADFIQVSSAADVATQLVTTAVRRPANAADTLRRDFFASSDSINGGPLVELLGPRLEEFENVLAAASVTVQTMFRELLASWAGDADPCLAELGETAIRGVATLLPTRLAVPLRGEQVHASAKCKPCVFHLRNQCRDADMCLYCHQDHPKTKRGSRGKRQQRRFVRERVPSLDGF